MLLLGLKTQIYCVHTSYKHRIYIVDNPILKKPKSLFWTLSKPKCYC